MSKLKTINVEGHAYFVTTKVIGSQNLFFFDKFCQIIIDNLNFYRKTKRFKLLGYVIMLDHLHMIIWPFGKFTISDILMNFKEFTAKQIIRELEENVTQHREALAPRPELAGESPARRGRLAFSGMVNYPEVLSNRENQVPRPDLHDNGAGRETRTSRLLAYFKEKAKNIRGQNYKVWMSRNWIENIYSDKFLEQKLEYIHRNPVKAGFVKDTADWKYSSARNYYLNDNSVIKIDIV